MRPSRYRTPANRTHSQRRGETDLKGSERGVRLSGLHARTDVFGENRPGAPGLPAIEEGHQARDREDPCADRPSGDIALQSLPWASSRRLCQARCLVLILHDVQNRIVPSGPVLIVSRDRRSKPKCANFQCIMRLFALINRLKNRLFLANATIPPAALGRPKRNGQHRSRQSSSSSCLRRTRSRLAGSNLASRRSPPAFVALTL